jgi:hypothetical protein
MKNLIFVMFTACLISAGCKKEGCTNSAATNYDTKAKEDNNTCEYDVSGLWKVVSFINGGTQVMDSYSYLNINLKSDGSSETEGLLLDGRIIFVEGGWKLTTNGSLQLTNTSGQSTIWTISVLDGQNMTMSSDDVADQPAKMVFTR